MAVRALLRSRFHFPLPSPLCAAGGGGGVRAFRSAAARGGDGNGNWRLHKEGAGMGTVSPWTVPYRELLGIGRSPVILARYSLSANRPIWSLPRVGEVKVTVEAFMPGEVTQYVDQGMIEIDDDTDDTFTGELVAMARNSSGDVLAIMTGNRMALGKWQMKLYALKAAANLVKKLKEAGKHVGPVTYETPHTQLCVWFCGMPIIGNFDPEKALMNTLPDDLDDIESSCNFFWWDELPEDVNESIKLDKLVAAKHGGLTRFTNEDGLQGTLMAMSCIKGRPN